MEGTAADKALEQDAHPHADPVGRVVEQSRHRGRGHFRERGRTVATPATGADARIHRRVALFSALIEPGPRGAAMTGCAALLAALAPRPRLLLLLALSPEQRLRQHGPARAELRKLGFQRLDAGHQRLLLDLQSPHLGAQPSDLLAQRHDHARGPHGRRPQPLVALAQPSDGAIPGLHQPFACRATTGPAPRAASAMSRLCLSADWPSTSRSQAMSFFSQSISS